MKEEERCLKKEERSVKKEEELFQPSNFTLHPSFLSELSEGILICSAEGEILFYNRCAARFLGMKDHADSRKYVCSVINKKQIEHALDMINEKLKRRSTDSVVYFMAKGHRSRLLRIQLVPILNQQSVFTGFILILDDITRQIEADKRAKLLLQSLTFSIRSAAASIRSAIEAILNYPDMQESQEKRFKGIIHKESLILSDILNKAGREGIGRISPRWSSVSGRDLIDMIAKKMGSQTDIVLNPEYPAEDINIDADTYLIISVVIFILDCLKNETGCTEFMLRLKKNAEFIYLEIVWKGSLVGIDTLRQWEKRFPCGETKLSSPMLSLKEILEYHEAEMFTAVSPEGLPCVSFILPAALIDESVFTATVLTESPSDNMLFDSADQIDNQLITELTFSALIRDISETRSIEEIIGKQSQLPEIINSMIAAGTRTISVTRLITTVSDAILKKVIDFAIKASGTPPVDFAFITLGSEGRMEQTLKTDQDNAIIFEDTEEKSTHDYFLNLGEKVCTWLDQAGYDFCEGGIMAKNPRWCKPLSVWKEYFYQWIHAASPEDLLHSSIFFDFRFAYGTRHLVDQLRQYLSDSISKWTGFLRYMTENSVQYRPPLSMFGNFILETKGEHKCLNIKTSMTLIVDFARIFALKNDIYETNTQERLYRLYLKNILTREEYNEIEQSYSFMMQLRFVRQIAAIMDEKTKPDNYINPKKLSAIERKTLKEIFKRIVKFQSKLSFEFTGMSDVHSR